MLQNTISISACGKVLYKFWFKETFKEDNHNYHCSFLGSMHCRPGSVSNPSTRAWVPFYIKDRQHHAAAALQYSR